MSPLRSLPTLVRWTSHVRGSVGQLSLSRIGSLGAKCPLDPVSLGCSFFLVGTLPRDPRTLLWHVVLRPSGDAANLSCHLGSLDTPVGLLPLGAQ